MWNLYTNMQGAEGVCVCGGGGNYQFSFHQKIDYQWEKQEESSCQPAEEDDVTSQLPLSVTLSSQWCMDVRWHRSPSANSQYYHAEECYIQTIGDGDPCYGMAKLSGGWGLKGGGWVFFIQYDKVSSPIAALEWLEIEKMLRKPQFYTQSTNIYLHRDRSPCLIWTNTRGKMKKNRKLKYLDRAQDESGTSVSQPLVSSCDLICLLNHTFPFLLNLKTGWSQSTESPWLSLWAPQGVH